MAAERERERVLTILQLQAEFELADAALALAQTTQQQRAAAQQVHRCDTAVQLAHGELRRQMGSPVLNPASYEIVRRLWRHGQQQLAAAQAELEQRESELNRDRDELANRRQRESEITRALSDQRRKQQLDRAARDGVVADDLWLLTNWSIT